MRSIVRLASIAVAVFYSVILATPALAADVRISEYMANPDVIVVDGALEDMAEPALEWIELQNITTAEVSLLGYKLVNSNGFQGYSFTAAHKIPANDRFVVCKNSSVIVHALNGEAISCDAEWDWTLSLANTGGTIYLVKLNDANQEIVVDEVTYDASQAQNGVAMEVGLDGSQTPATTPYGITNVGTPGYDFHDNTPPSVPTNDTPLVKSNSTNLQKLDWNDSTDNGGGQVWYVYESSLNGQVGPGGNFTDPVYTSGLLPTSEIPTPNTPDGMYFWHVRALDNHGNTSAWSANFTAIVESVAPVVTVDPVSTSNKSPKVTGTVSDSGVIDTLIVEINGELFIFNNPVDTWEISEGAISELAPGTYDVKVTATDEYGNVGTDNTTDEIEITPIIKPNETVKPGNTGVVVVAAPATPEPTPSRPIFHSDAPADPEVDIAATSSANTGDNKTLGDSDNKKSEAVKTTNNKKISWWWLVAAIIAVAAALYAFWRRRQQEQEA